MREHSAAVRHVPCHDVGVDHQQFVSAAGLTPEHQPTESHLCVHRQNDLRQLHLTNACVELVSQRTDFGRFFFGLGLADMQLVINVQLTSVHCGCDRFGTRLNLSNQGFQKFGQIARQRQTRVMRTRLSLPPIRWYEQSCAPPETQAVFNPD